MLDQVIENQVVNQKGKVNQLLKIRRLKIFLREVKDLAFDNLAYQLLKINKGLFKDKKKKDTVKKIKI